MLRNLSCGFQILVALLLVSVVVISAAADSDIEKFQKDIVGSWIVDVVGDTRTRTLNIRGGERRPDGVWVLDATYGWTDGGQSAVRAQLIAKPDGYSLQLTTPAPGNSLISAEYSGPALFSGTFTWSPGKTKAVRLERMPGGLKQPSAFNTMGADDSTAISGYDPVAFHTANKALRGDPKLSHSYGGAKWVFATEENMMLFKSNPEKYLPAWGGHCAWAVSENLLSRKLLSGDFEVIDGKVYLFSFGNDGKSSARDGFLRSRKLVYDRVRDGNRYWPDLKRKLEDGSIVQATSKNYKKSPFEEPR
jgi:YHS domain-containing protein